jgi:hypothetical protein
MGFSNGTDHITSAGWVTPVVDPEQFGIQGNQSAEAQAFVLDMQAAWQDWLNAGSKGPVSGAMREAIGWYDWWWWYGWIIILDVGRGLWV